MSLTPSQLRAMHRLPAQIQPARNWPDKQDYAGSCRKCGRMFKGEKGRVQGCCCYLCAGSPVPVNIPAPMSIEKACDEIFKLLKPATGPATTYADKLNEFVKKGEARLVMEDAPLGRCADGTPWTPDLERYIERKRTADVGVSFTIPGQPVGKPRQTRRDVWKKRPCVMRYRAWADRARAAAPDSMPKEPSKLHIVAYLSFPKSWRPNLRKALTGQPHRHKPDADNIIKSCADALFSRDEGISRMLIEKYWDDGNGPRMEVTVI